MQKLTLRQIALLVLPLLVAAPSAAQDRAEPTLKPYRSAGGAPAGAAGLGDWARLNRLPLNAELRVALASKRVLKGKLLDVTDDVLILRMSGGRQESIAAGEILRIHHVRHDPLANGLLIGLASGAGTGAALGGLAARDEEFTGYVVIPLTWIGAGIGAAIGAVADSARVEMDLVYEKAPAPVARQD